VRIFHLRGDHFSELAELPAAMPPSGYLWVSSARSEFEVHAPVVQARLARWGFGTIVEEHVSDLLNRQLPSHYDYTSWYELLVFRRLAVGPGGASAPPADAAPVAAELSANPLDAIDTSPVGFAVFDRVLLTVHPTDCPVREYFAARFAQQVQPGEARTAARLPTSPPDLTVRMVNHMVDGYLELRRLLTRQLTTIQRELLDPRSRFDRWQVLLDARNALNMLEDTCEDQRAAITEWIDSLDELADTADAAGKRERELLRVRSRDVLEHIERVLGHVRRLGASAESAVQMHFSAQSHRTNDIMRTLTVLTAIFLPLNLVTGFFGMNFDDLPLIHSVAGFWFVAALLIVVGAGLAWLFWRKRYIESGGTRE
jgi:Mg2+ and Co2+ transporter CorA